MSTKLKELLTRGESRAKELSAFIAEHGDNMTSENYAKAETIRADLAEIRSQVEICQKTQRMGDEAAEFTRLMSEPAAQYKANDPSTGKSGVIGSTRSGSVTVKREGKALRSLRQSGPAIFGREAFAAISEPKYEAAYRKYLLRGERSLSPSEVRTLQDGYDPQGGFLAPTQWQARLIQRKPTPTRVAGLVESVNCTSDSMSMPRVNYSTASDDSGGTLYSTGFRVTATDENPTSDTQSQVTDTNLFGSTRISVFTYMIQGRLTNNQVEDAMFDPMAFMDEKFMETADLLKDNMLINGIGGASNPYGMLAAPTVSDPFLNAPTVSSGTNASPYLTADSLINISEDIPEQYDENIVYLYKKTSTGKTIRTLKDSTNRYLLGKGDMDSGLVNPRAKTLNGYPVINSQFMPDPAANPSYPVICGDLKGVCLVNRIGFSIQVLREVGALRNQVILVGRIRFGCQPIEPWRYRILSVPS